jgi:hypothetical protein
MLSALFATWVGNSVAAFLRIGLLLSGEHNSPVIKSWLPTAPIVLWAGASLLFVLVWLTYKRASVR